MGVPATLCVKQRPKISQINKCGTRIILHLKSNAYDFMLDDKIKQIILAYSDHIAIPIYINTEDTPVNTASALWMRSKSEITQEQYNEFYHHIGHVFDEPIMTSHWRAGRHRIYRPVIRAHHAPMGFV